MTILAGAVIFLFIILVVFILGVYSVFSHLHSRMTNLEIDLDRSQSSIRDLRNLCEGITKNRLELNHINGEIEHIELQLSNIRNNQLRDKDLLREVIDHVYSET